MTYEAAFLGVKGYREWNLVESLHSKRSDCCSGSKVYHVSRCLSSTAIRRVLVCRVLRFFPCLWVAANSRVPVPRLSSSSEVAVVSDQEALALQLLCLRPPLSSMPRLQNQCLPVRKRRWGSVVQTTFSGLVKSKWMTMSPFSAGETSCC